MYAGHASLPERVAEYFVERFAGRAILQTDQLNGRDVQLPESAHTCRRFHDRAPHCHEMVGSFKEEPERQGGPEMTVYNFRRMGNPLYLQLWRRDADDPKYAQRLLDAWQRFKERSLEEIEETLRREGLYVEKSDWDREAYFREKRRRLAAQGGIA